MIERLKKKIEKQKIDEIKEIKPKTEEVKPKAEEVKEVKPKEEVNQSRKRK